MPSRSGTKLSIELETECKAVYVTMFEDVSNKISSKSDLIKALQNTGRNPSTYKLNTFWKENTRFLTFQDFLRICEQIPPTTEEDLLKAFRKMDTDNNGFISRDEFLISVTSKGQNMSNSEAEETIKKVDTNRDGKLDYKEFCQLLLSNVNEYKILAKQNLMKKNKTKQEYAKTQLNTEADSDDNDIVISNAKRLQNRQGAIGSSLPIESTFGGNFVSKKPKTNGGFQKNLRGAYFYYECENGRKVLLNHTYDLVLPQDSYVHISMKLKTDLNLLSSNSSPDLGFLLVQNEKPLYLSEQADENGLVEIGAKLNKGTYQILPIASGVNFKPRINNPGPKAKLLKKTMDGKLALTTAFKEALTDIFNICDLDCNGQLSRDEFSLYSQIGCGEILNDSLWAVIENNCKLVNGEIILDDFIDLNLKEAEEDKGDPANLWTTLEMMGFNSHLFMDETFPFEIKFHCENCSSASVKVPPLKIPDQNKSNDHRTWEACLSDYVIAKGNCQELKSSKNLKVYYLCAAPRALVAIKSDSQAKVNIDCSQSRNLLFLNDTKKLELTSKVGQEIVVHAISDNCQQISNLRCSISSNE